MLKKTPQVFVAQVLIAMLLNEYTSDRRTIFFSVSIDDLFGSGLFLLITFCCDICATIPTGTNDFSHNPGKILSTVIQS